MPEDFFRIHFQARLGLRRQTATFAAPVGCQQSFCSALRLAAHALGQLERCNPSRLVG
jgi:hypothetical protein